MVVGRGGGGGGGGASPCYDAEPCSSVLIRVLARQKSLGGGYPPRTFGIYVFMYFLPACIYNGGKLLPAVMQDPAHRVAGYEDQISECMGLR